MNTHLLIDAIVQQTMVFIAQLATAGGVRAPLAHVADQVFLDLTHELTEHGVTKKVIADMFGMALRTYHRRVQETLKSQTDQDRTVWEAVLEFVREAEPVSGVDVLSRFARDDAEVVSGVLSDLVSSGLAYRAGRGERAVYRAAHEADFAASDDEAREARAWLVWLGVYRKGPASAEQIAQHVRLPLPECLTALERLASEGKAERTADGSFTAARFEVPVGEAHGWEAAVLDHYQAMVSSICQKLSERGAASRAADTTGGSTWSLDVWPGHPLEAEAKGVLRRVRAEMEGLRDRIDAYNSAGAEESASPRERVIVYLGQSVRTA
jgi:hypothetical protein